MREAADFPRSFPFCRGAGLRREGADLAFLANSMVADTPAFPIGTVDCLHFNGSNIER
jgi:hypothetical protein